jgi:hypothetical protein
VSSSTEYLLHYFRRLQDNNYDVMTLCSGSKGFGKSSATISLAIDYLSMFGFVCPHCGAIFFKNVYAKRTDASGRTDFYIPEYVKNDTANIQCPLKYDLDLKTGERKVIGGCGKTFKWSGRKVPKWDPNTYIAYDNKQVLEKVYSLPDYAPMVCDEAIKFAAGQSHMKAESKAMKELMTLIRPRRFLMFFNIPEFSWLDSKYREGMSSFWLRMVERGVGVLFEKDKGEAKEKYHIKEMEKLMGTVKFFTPMDKIKSRLRKHPCYFDTFRFPELDKKVYDEYELVRNAINLQRQVEEMQLSNKDVAKIAVYNLFHNWDRIKIAVDRSKEARPTYSILSGEVLVNPLTRQTIASDATLRNWVTGVENYIKSKGQAQLAFEGEAGDVKKDDDVAEIEL